MNSIMCSHVPHSIFPKLLSFARKFPFRPPKHPCFPVYLLTPCDLCSLPCHLYMTLKPSSSVVLFQSPSHLVFYWALSFSLNIFLVTFFPLPIQPSLSPPLSLSFHNFFLLNYSQVFVTQWTIALQAPVSMEFFRQEFWSRGFSRESFPPRDQIYISCGSCIAGGFFTTSTTCIYKYNKL